MREILQYICGGRGHERNYSNSDFCSYCGFTGYDLDMDAYINVCGVQGHAYPEGGCICKICGKENHKYNFEDDDPDDFYHCDSGSNICHKCGTQLHWTNYYPRVREHIIYPDGRRRNLY